MYKLGNYIFGEWMEGKGEGKSLYDAVTGDVVALATSDGLDLAEVLDYGRRSGGPALRKMTFQQRGNMLKKLALFLTRQKEQFYEISYKTGATRRDSWIDIEGGFGNLFSNASLRRNFTGQAYHVDGEGVDLSRGGPFMGHHIMVPKRGVAVHINAFNFPVWGMLEKCAVNWMAGVPAVVKPATATAYLTEAVVRVIIESGILPEGALQLICGGARNILDGIQSQDVVTFTGSAETGRKLKAHPRVISESVPFNLEADSLNCSVLGLDALPGTPEFDLFIKEVTREMTVKCGQKCTAIRRIIVPESVVEDVQIALGKRLSKTQIGNPRSEHVRMGALASKDQVLEVRDRVKEIAETAEIVYGTLDSIELVDADFDKGAFLSPILLLEPHPTLNTNVHRIEAFGPVSTIMPYRDLHEAIELSHLGKGSLCSSIVTYDDQIAREFVLEAATHHGRILVINRENAKHQTGHGSPLPSLIHGGPGRAGGGEEMGGVRGITHYMQRCAIQGTPTTVSAITGIYQPNGNVQITPQHPFTYHFEDIQPGMSIMTHKRTITDSDIQNFANLTWDHFYAHTDITSLEGSIFERRAAHGYFLLSAGAGLFVHPNKGPVGANYGLESCRFLKPVYHNDTIQVRLTCKEKIDRDAKGKEFPSGVVKWYEEIFDQEGELVAMATILTLVQKRCPFVDVPRAFIIDRLNALTADATPSWGMMSAQHMVEHLEHFSQIALGNIHVDMVTPEQKITRYQESLWNYRPMPQGFKQPFYQNDKPEELRFASLQEAIKAYLQAYDEIDQRFKNDADFRASNPVFGKLDSEMYGLLNRKHLNHHFKQFNLI